MFQNQEMNFVYHQFDKLESITQQEKLFDENVNQKA